MSSKLFPSGKYATYSNSRQYIHEQGCESNIFCFCTAWEQVLVTSGGAIIDGVISRAVLDPDLYSTSRSPPSLSPHHLRFVTELLSPLAHVHAGEGERQGRERGREGGREHHHAFEKTTETSQIHNRIVTMNQLILRGSGNLLYSQNKV